MKNAYERWSKDWTVAKTKASKEAVLRRASDGDYGEEVRFSLFGLGEYDPSHPPDAQTIRNMSFYVRFDGMSTDPK